MLGTWVSGEKRAGTSQTTAVLYVEILKAVGTVRGKTWSVENPASQGGRDGIRDFMSARLWDGL